MRALEREPERRFANVTELSDALCFAAGIATRSQQGAPISQLATVGAAQSGSAPHGHGPMAPHGYGAPTPSAYAGHTPAQMQSSGTPPPGAMTNAPFTSESSAHASSGRGKLVIGGLFAGVLAIAATVGAVFFLKSSAATQHDATNGVVASPPVSAVAVPSAPEAKTDDKDDDKDDDKEKAAPPSTSTSPAPPATAETSAAGTSATLAATKPAKAPATTKTTTTTKPAIPTLPPPTTATAATTTAPPVPTSTAKKPRDRTDPGY